MKHQHILIFLLVAAILLVACGGPNTRNLGTPMPKYIPATPPQFAFLQAQTPSAGQQPCQIHAVDLLGAWVTAGAKEDGTFPFTDINDATCQGTFTADIQPLFLRANTWYKGAPACVTCHFPDTANAWAQLDLSSYAGIIAGSRRTTPDAKGSDILGAGNWEKAILYNQLHTLRMPPGRPAEANPNGPLVTAGVH